jgi:Zn finger protein HypA/HybF involved in hydrogenase expression
MAEFRCRDCKKKGTFTYVGKYECPTCGSKTVQIALTIEEMEDDHPVIVAIKKIAETGGKD